MTDFCEVADRIWVGRYPWFDMNVTVIGSDRGLVVVDTQASALGGREVLDDLRRLQAAEVHAVINTHWHFDHTFGNIAFREADPDVPIHATAEAARNLADWGPEIINTVAREGGPRSEEIVATTLVIPDQTFSTRRVLDLGDREIELIHPGRGHTAGDLVVHVPDAGVLLAGDLVEESGPPGISDDSWLFEWPDTLEQVLARTAPTTVVVPGHGAVVDPAFVARQRTDLAQVSTTIEGLVESGVPVEEALASGSWPWPTEALTRAVAVGYAQLGSS